MINKKIKNELRKNDRITTLHRRNCYITIFLGNESIDIDEYEYEKLERFIERVSKFREYQNKKNRVKLTGLFAS